METIAPVRDDPPWSTVQLSASYAQDENVGSAARMRLAGRVVNARPDP